MSYTNPYYTHSTGWPVQGSRGASSSARTEDDSIANGFEKVFNYGVDVGTANAIVIPALTGVTSLTDGLVFRVKTAFASSGAATFTPGSLGTLAIKYPDGTALVANSYLAGQVIELIYNATTGTVQYNPNSLLVASNGLPLTGGTMSGPINEFEGAAVAIAAGVVNLTTSTGNMVHITGSTAITSMPLTAGQRTIVFDGAPLLTASSNLILPNNLANIQAAAGDTAIVWAEGGGVTRLITYTKANGQSLSVAAAAVLLNYQIYGAF